MTIEKDSTKKKLHQKKKKTKIKMDSNISRKKEYIALSCKTNGDDIMPYSLIMDKNPKKVSDPDSSRAISHPLFFGPMPLF